MLQPIAVLREAGVNWWWLRVQNSRFSDTLLGPLSAYVERMIRANNWRSTDGLSAGPAASVLPWVLFLGVIALVTYLAVSNANLLARSLRKTRPAGWALGMAVPVVYLVVLLVLSGEATRALRSRGIKVGLLGASMADIRDIEEPATAQADSADAPPDSE
jgi:hypothetical protein